MQVSNWRLTKPKGFTRLHATVVVFDQQHLTACVGFHFVNVILKLNLNIEYTSLMPKLFRSANDYPCYIPP